MIDFDQESLILELRNPSGYNRVNYIDTMEGFNPNKHLRFADKAYNKAISGDTSALDRYGLKPSHLQDENGDYYDQNKCEHIIAVAIVETNIENRGY